MPSQMETISSLNNNSRLVYTEQEKGQRKYGGPPPGWTGPPPPRGCEVFIGKLPRNLFEDQLLPLLSQAGLVYELRLMVDFSGSNKGYCFAVYASHDEAKRACHQLNNFEIVPGKHIGVVMSVDNRRLFVGGIPRERYRDDIKTELTKLTEGVVDVILYPSAMDKSKNRGFAFVEYDNHRAAAMARQKLIRDRVQLWGQPICVDWAEPEQDVDEETMANVKILYVRNLMLSTTEESLRRLFEEIRPGSVERVKKLKDYAFVHFFCRVDALYCMEKSNGITHENAELEVVLAKPPDRTIMRYVKNVQKIGGQMLPQGPTVHQSIVAAATQMYAAAATGHAQLPPGQLTPSGTLTPPSPPTGAIPSLPMVGDPVTWAYTGMPFIDPGYAAYHQAMTLANERFTNNGCTRVSRGAAGMRAAGFQAFVNSQVRKNRRRYAEAALMYELVPYGTPQTQVAQSMVPPTLPGGPLPTGLVLIPTMSGPMSSPSIVPSLPHSIPQTPTTISMSPTTNGSPPLLQRSNYVEQLEQHCVKQDWGSPIYELTTVLTKEGSGRDVHLFMYKVTIPALSHNYGSFQPQQSNTDPEDAKEYAAMFTLCQLGLPLAHTQIAIQPQHLIHHQMTTMVPAV